MVNFYVRRIQKGLMTLEEVPERWHEAVSFQLDAFGLDVGNFVIIDTVEDVAFGSDGNLAVSRQWEDGHAECGQGVAVQVIGLVGVCPAGTSRLHGLGVPFVCGIGFVAHGLCRDHAHGIASHIDHRLSLSLVVVGVEGNGAAGNIGVTLHHFPAIYLHPFRLVQVHLQVVVDVIGGLLYAQQDVVDVLHRDVQRLFGIVDGLLLQRLAREVEHDSQRYCEQQHDFTHDEQVQS